VAVVVSGLLGSAAMMARTSSLVSTAEFSLCSLSSSQTWPRDMQCDVHDAPPAATDQMACAFDISERRINEASSIEIGQKGRSADFFFTQFSPMTVFPMTVYLLLPTVCCLSLFTGLCFRVPSERGETQHDNNITDFGSPVTDFSVRVRARSDRTHPGHPFMNLIL
jgi:hypothetical protein